MLNRNRSERQKQAVTHAFHVSCGEVVARHERDLHRKHAWKFDLVLMWQHATHSTRHGVALYAPTLSERTEERWTRNRA